MGWEFKQVRMNAHGAFSPDIDEGQEVLDRYAKDGWELVTVLPLVYLTNTARVYYIFKRPT